MQLRLNRFRNSFWRIRGTPVYRVRVGINTFQCKNFTVQSTTLRIFRCVTAASRPQGGAQNKWSIQVLFWTPEEKSVQIFIPCERSFSLVFWEEEWLVGATRSTLNYGSTGPRWSEIADFEPIIARSASAVIPSEKSSINTNTKSTTRFPMSLRWSSCP